jgi:hypothetical protein
VHEDAGFVEAMFAPQKQAQHDFGVNAILAVAIRYLAQVFEPLSLSSRSAPLMRRPL